MEKPEFKVLVNEGIREGIANDKKEAEKSFGVRQFAKRPLLTFLGLATVSTIAGVGAVKGIGWVASKVGGKKSEEVLQAAIGAGGGFDLFY